MPKLPEELAEELDLALEGFDSDFDSDHEHGHEHEHAHQHHEHHHHHHGIEEDMSHLGISSSIAKNLALRSFHCVSPKKF